AMPSRSRTIPLLATLVTLALVAPSTAPADQQPAPPEDCRGDAYRSYDYILGNWHNAEKDLDENDELVVVGTGESHIHEIVGGCGIVEHRTSYRGGGEHARLMFVRAYDHERDRWNQVLTTDFPAYIVWSVQRLDARRTRFTTSRILEGDTVHVRMTEEPLGRDAFRRTFESSRDGRRTWALDVVVDYTRVGRPAAATGPTAAVAGAGVTGRPARGEATDRDRAGPVVSADTSEEAAVRAALQHYLNGHATGDGSHHRRVFHPESRLFWILDGELSTRTSEEYIAGAPGEPAEDEARRRRRIAMVDVTGTAAVAKVELDYPDAFITDYFSLLKIDGEWKVMNKIFHVRTPTSTSMSVDGRRARGGDRSGDLGRRP
ncbi:MAG: nuclear transport factor 2 family protein, partial [Gemmatimonadota bacterium]